jgi:hypothetical protein
LRSVNGRAGRLPVPPKNDAMADSFAGSIQDAEIAAAAAADAARAETEAAVRARANADRAAVDAAQEAADTAVRAAKDAAAQALEDAKNTDPYDYY